MKKTNGAEDNYVYYNRRPDGQHLQDCVCRAISTAVGINYESVDNLLEMSSKNYQCQKLCVCCYHHLLGKIFNYTCLKPINKQTVEEVAKNFPADRLIIRVQGHLTCSINGKIPDIWDCSDEIVDCFWIVH